MNRALLILCLLALCFGAYGTLSSHQAHRKLAALGAADAAPAPSLSAIQVEALSAMTNTLGERVLELESQITTSFEGRVRGALAQDPQMIFDAIDLMNARATQTALAEALPALENEGLLPVLGNPEGDVTLIEFYDYNCGYCRQVLSDVVELVAEDGNIRLILREFPILSRESQEAAITALAAADDVDFLELHRRAMAHNGRVDGAVMLDLAVALGADRSTVATRAALERQAYMTQLSQTQEIAGTLGITGTPAFIIGDQVLPGAVSKAQMADAVADFRDTL